ncbi:MAG: hypothetical protein U1G07_27520 [Verrucomicrobiota bacterium]
MTLLIDGGPTREFEIELADGQPDWWAFIDVAPFQGKKATVRVNKLPDDSVALKSIEASDAIRNSESLYRERLRPQFHFTGRRGWNNDPNGLVYYQGEYHLFFQHNPYGWNWGNMHWGTRSAVTLVHWTELPIALYPDDHGTMFSRLGGGGLAKHRWLGKGLRRRRCASSRRQAVHLRRWPTATTAAAPG